MNNKPTCEYIVIARYADENINSSKKYLGIEKVFNARPDNPILDREAAFRYRNEIIRSLLEVKGVLFEELNEIELRDKLCELYFKSNEEYNSHSDSKNYFYTDNQKNELQYFDDSISWYPAPLEGIWVVMHHNDKLLYEAHWWDEENQDKVVIDKIINKGIHFKNHIPPLTEALEVELSFYNKNEYSTVGDEGQYVTEVEYCDHEVFKEGEFASSFCKPKFLKTPFDWSGYDKPFWWGEPCEQRDWKFIEMEKWEEKMPSSDEVWNIHGENEFKEFKPALHFNTVTKKGSLGQMHRVAKAICSFLNSNGGYVYIGVDDNGGIIGVENDLSLVKIHGREGQDPEDYFQLKFGELKRKFFDKSISSLMKGYFSHIDDQTIFIIAVQPSPEPVFLRKVVYDKETNTNNETKEFYYRSGSESPQITDIESVLNYCKVKWGWKSFL